MGRGAFTTVNYPTLHMQRTLEGRCHRDCMVLKHRESRNGVLHICYAGQPATAPDWLQPGRHLDMVVIRPGDKEPSIDGVPRHG